MAKRPPLPAGVTQNWIFTGSEQVSLTDDGRTLTIQRASGSNKGTSSFPIGQVSGVQIDRPGLMQPLGRFRVLVAGEVAPRRSQGMLETARDPFVVQFNKRLLPNFERFAQSVRDAQAAAARGVPAPAAGAAAGLADQLAQLATLKAQGVLSDAEFAAAKARLLGVAAAGDVAPGTADEPPGETRW